MGKSGKNLKLEKNGPWLRFLILTPGFGRKLITIAKKLFLTDLEKIPGAFPSSPIIFRCVIYFEPLLVV